MKPKHVLGLSGGHDSTCLALAMRERYPDLDMEYICTPTGNELPELFEHLDRLETTLGKPIKRLGIGKTLHQLIDEMEMLPNFRARWCTRMLKIEPAIEYMTSLPAGSLLYVGLRADEEERERASTETTWPACFRFANGAGRTPMSGSSSTIAA